MKRLTSNLRQQRKEKRRRQILQAASRVFPRKSYWEADMESICRLAGLAKGTVYLYFSSKEELFLSLVDSILKELVNEVTSLLKENLSVTETLETVVEIYLNFFQKHSAYFSILFVEAPELRLKVARRFWKKLLTIIKSVQPRYRAAVASGEIRPIPLPDIVFMLTGMIQGAIFQWLLSNRSYSLPDRARAIKTVFLRGLVKS
ncbi:MAG TPA: TetR/AcrR family transcriptional regulator [bacterium]|nr:TetR/AcrR family transcriptional regulator [bacterium]HPP11733.1 TetR/AcrR family transcriptional regulator [bacterium]